MLTLTEAKEYLGIDYADTVTDANVQRALNAAVQRVRGAVGVDLETYLPGDPRTEQLTLLYLAENYDERAASMKQASVRSRLTADLELQLRLELRAAKTEAGGAG